MSIDNTPVDKEIADLMQNPSIYRAITTLRQIGLNDTLIACVISDIRVATLSVERWRLETLYHTNPPKYPSFCVFADLLEEVK